MTFTDSAGREWDVIDFRTVPGEGDRKKRVTLGSDQADGRAFYRPDDVRVYRFGIIRSRWPTPRDLQVEFDAARPLSQSPAERHWGR